jgi:hypothetical protein
MKTILLLVCLLPLIGCAVGPDGKRTFPPIKVKACYMTPQGSICAGTDGKAVVIEGNISTPNATVTFGK